MKSGACKKVNILKINKCGGPNKVRRIGKKIEKLIIGGMFIWHLRLRGGRGGEKF